MKQPFLEKVSIIVLNHNGQKFLKGCFSSLEKLNYPAYEVFLADDCSTDDSIEYVKKKFPRVKIFKNKKNFGAPMTFNKVIKRIKTNLVVKADNDIMVDKNWLKEMVLTIKNDPNIGVVGSKLLHYKKDKVKDDIQEIGSNIDQYGYPDPINDVNLKGSLIGKSIINAFYVSGCSMLFKKNVFEKAGRFDPKFFIYKDDLDFCWRIRLLGFKVVTNLNSKMYHLSGQLQGGTSVLDKQGRYHTTVKKRYFGERNTLRTLIKNYSGFTLMKVLPGYLAILLAEILFFTLIGKFKVARSYLKMIYWNLQNLPDTWREHQIIQQKRVIADRVIVQNMIKGSSKLKAFRTIKVPIFD